MILTKRGIEIINETLLQYYESAQKHDKFIRPLDKFTCNLCDILEEIDRIHEIMTKEDFARTISIWRVSSINFNKIKELEFENKELRDRIKEMRENIREMAETIKELEDLDSDSEDLYYG